MYTRLILRILTEDLLCVRPIVPGAGDTIVNETDKHTAFNELTIPGW